MAISPLCSKSLETRGTSGENFIEMDDIENYIADSRYTNKRSLMWWGLFIIHYQNHYVDPGNLWGRLYWYGLFWNLYYIKIFLRSGFTDKFSTYSNICVYQIWYMYAIEGLRMEWKINLMFISINFMFIFHFIALVPPPLLQMYPGQSDKREKAL